MAECPETIEELEALEQLLPLCKRTLYETAQAKIAAGAAPTERQAIRQIADETGRPFSTVDRAVQREKHDRVLTMSVSCEKVPQRHPKYYPVPEGGEGEEEDYEQTCGHCQHYDYDRRLCWLHKDDTGMDFTCDDFKLFPENDQELEKEFKCVLATLHTGDQESYTPEKYIESARLVMGSIDLDPASNDMAQKTVKAAAYYTKGDNGLDKSWPGNIFLNPPYSHPEIKYFVDKLLAELKPGQQAILLTNNNTDTNFFHDAAKSAAAVCFTKGRINFTKADGSTSSPTNGQTFFYFGENKQGFIEEFSQYGLIMELSEIGLSRNN